MERWTNGVERLQRFVAGLPDVEALGLFGSATQAAEQDAWSDIDSLLVLADGTLGQFYPAVDWLTPLGDLFTYEQSASEHTCTTRCVFTDGRRLDLVLATTASLQQLSLWPSVPWWRGITVVFARTEAVRAALVSPAPAPTPPTVSPETIDTLLRKFWFKAVLAVTKVARGDLLIALHLTLDLQRDCAVLGMLLRDRATGTTIHRTGGMGNAVVAQLDATRGPFTAEGILTMIEQSGVLCDRLASEWDAAHRDQRDPLLQFVAQARVTLG